MALGQHGSQHQLRRGARRGRRRDAGQHVTGDSIGHLLAQLRVELWCPGEELACHVGLAGAQSG